MQNIIIEKPYVPVSPHRGNLWPRILSLYLPRMLRKRFGIVKVDCVHADRLTKSLAAGHGILLTPNHCRDADPMVMGVLAKAVRSPFFVVASWHLFMQNPFQTFMLRRAGAFSIYREGIDRVAINTSVDILENATRPLVIFPEGLIARTNDRLNELLEGTALIARSAAKKRAKLSPPGKVVVHPIAIRYRFLGDIESAVKPVLDDIETRLTWRPLKNLPLLDRIYKTGGALLTLKELEYLGEARSGDIASRLANLIDAILLPLEKEWLPATHPTDPPNTRVKRLRAAILPDMTVGDLDEPERQRRWLQLADLYLVQQLFHYPPDYVKANATPERFLETIERFDEDITDHVRILGPIQATITVGEPIEVPPSGEGLMDQIEHQLKSLLGLDGAA